MIYSSWLPGQPSHSRKHFYYYCHYKTIFLYLHNSRLCYLSKWKFAQSPPPYNFLPVELAKYANLHNFSLSPFHGFPPLHPLLVPQELVLSILLFFVYIYIFCIKEHTTCLYVFYKVWPWVLHPYGIKPTTLEYVLLLIF